MAFTVLVLADEFGGQEPTGWNGPQDVEVHIPFERKV